jgi:LacI family transcriptional regulator
VGHDHRQAGADACEHLLRHGYRRLAYFGSADSVIQRFCRAQLAGVAGAAGLEPREVSAFFNGPRTQERWTLPNQLSDLAVWLGEQPMPLGLVTWDDEHAHRATLAIRQASLRCPEDVAVVSAYSNGAHCLISDPPLTSIVVNERGLGYEAATMLELLIDGKRPDCRLLPPLAVVPRQSSLHFAVEDPLVADALWLIWRSLEGGVSVQWVAGQLHCSRRTLTRRFKSAVGRTPSEEIAYARVEMTKRLLIQTDLPLADIAIRCGFEYISHLSRAVKKATGLPPSIYRRTYKPGGQG